MSEQTKYFYLKLKENFFDSDELKILEGMPDGILYSNILLKMYCRSLKHEGRLMFNDTIPYNSTILASLTGHKVGVIEKAITIFKQLGLIDILDNGAIYILHIQNFIGKSSNEADRIRNYRSQIDCEKKSIKRSKKDTSVQMYDICTPELELETETKTDIELEIDNTCQKKTTRAYDIKEIFEHWKSIMNHQQARLDEKRIEIIKRALNMGYSKDDLCMAITGCSKTPHNIGKNEMNQRFDGIHIILRNADQIDRFIENYGSPPANITEAQQRVNKNVDTMREWASAKSQELNGKGGK